MLNEFSRTALLLGADAMNRLERAHIAVFGIGGVGGHAVEALARCGVGRLDLIDNDTVSLTNINRQMVALHSTIGQFKVDVAAARITDINPKAIVRTFKTFYLPETANQFDFTEYDYIIDAIDTVTAKLDLAERAYHAGTPIISAMGAGNKLDPTAFEVTDIFKTAVCPLARVMRTELRRRHIPKLKVVYSKEPPLSPIRSGETPAECTARRAVPGSISFVPSVAGLILAGAVIRDLISPDPAAGQP